MRSTISAVKLVVNSTVYCIYKRKHCATVFTGLLKPFDAVAHILCLFTHYVILDLIQFVVDGSRITCLKDFSASKLDTAALILKPLDSVYHSALRFITGDAYDTPHCILYNIAGWSSLAQRLDKHLINTHT